MKKNILDSQQNWHAHCEYICGKISKGIGIIIKARKVFNETTFLLLYNSLILPYVSYCIHMSGTWYSYCQKIFVHAIGIVMYKYLSGMLPVLFLDMFTPISDIHNYATRQTINKNSRSQQSITYIGPHVWNFILSKINPRCPIGSFKRHIRQLLQHCVRLDVVITDIKTTKRSHYLDLHVFIYMHIDPYVIYIYLYT